MSLSSILVVAPHFEACRGIIKGILGCNSDLDDDSQECTIQKYRWQIKNKYYTVNVNLCPVTEGKTIDKKLLDSTEAIIIYIQNLKGGKLSDIDKWKNLIESTDSQIQILLCDICNDQFPRDDAMSWCLNHEFELIELLEKPEIEEDCILEDFYGIERVINSLHSHTWPGYSKNDELIENYITNDFTDEEDDNLEYIDQFSKLFSQISHNAQNAATMPSDQRKAYAEQVVTAFWKAIGGEDAELEDIVNEEQN